MRYRVIFRKKYTNELGFCVNYRPLLHRGESFLSYIVAERLKERGVLDEVFNLRVVEEELEGVIKRVGRVYLASCIYVHRPWEEDWVLSEEKYIKAIEEFDLFKGMNRREMELKKVGGVRNFSLLRREKLGVGIDYSKWRTYIQNNFEGRGGVANKLWEYYLVDADAISFVIESDLSREEIEESIGNREYSFFSKRRFIWGRYICNEVVECEDEIVRFVPLEGIVELAKEYEVRVINEVVVREGVYFVPWYGKMDNGVYCAIGARKTSEEMKEEIGEDVKKAYSLRDLDLRLGSILIGADVVDKKGLAKEKGICGLCRYEGEVYRKVRGDFWGSFTMQGYLYNTEYLCESCLALKGLAGKKSEYKQFIQVNFEKYNWRDREGLGVELPREGYLIVSKGGGAQALFYFGCVNYIYGSKINFYLANSGVERFYTRLGIS